MTGKYVCYYCGKDICVGEIYSPRTKKDTGETIYLHIQEDCSVNQKAIIANREKACGK